MRKLLIPLFLLLVACAGDVPDAESVVGLGNPDPMAISCATNFTRVSPRVCYTDIAQSTSNLTQDGVCRSLDFNAVYGMPLNTQVVMAVLTGNQTSVTSFYNSNTCATLIENMLILSTDQFIRVYSGVLYYRSALNYGTTATIRPVMYYDF